MGPSASSLPSSSSLAPWWWSWSAPLDAVQLQELLLAVEKGRGSRERIVARLVAVQLEAGDTATATTAATARTTTPLHEAAKLGFTGAMERLLLGMRQQLGLGARMARGGDRDVMAVALAAAVNAVDAEGMTPLYWAARHCRDDAVGLLLAAGADPNVRDCNRCAPLHLVARGDSGTGLQGSHGSCERTLELLLAAGADLNARDRFGQTALFTAVWHQASTPKATGGRCIELLLTAGADPNLPDGSRRTPLHLVARYINPVATHLIQHGADPFLLDKNGESALDLARTAETRAHYLSFRWRCLRGSFVRFLNGLGPLRTEVCLRPSLLPSPASASAAAIDRALWTGQQEYTRELLSWL